MTRRLAILALLLALSPDMAKAGLSRAALESVAVKLPSQARLYMSLSAPDIAGKRHSLRDIAAGRLVFLNFVDYTCNTLCGTDLMLLADGIRRAGLKPAQYRIIVFGIDPKDSAADAIKMESDEIPPALRPASVFLLPNKQAVAKATTALGYHYVYDPQTDQFAHPVIVYAIGPDGGVRALLSPLSLMAGDLRQALQAPVAASLYDRIHALCYGYDPATGVYTPRVFFLLKVGAVFTLLAMALLALVSRGRRRA